MSSLQYGTLKYISNHEVTVDDAQGLNMGTFGSLITHGWVTREGNRLEVTKPGHLALDAYRLAGANFRQVEAPISDRVRGLLHLSELRAVKKAS